MRASRKQHSEYHSVLQGLFLPVYSTQLSIENESHQLTPNIITTVSGAPEIERASELHAEFFFFKFHITVH